MRAPGTTFAPRSAKQKRSGLANSDVRAREEYIVFHFPMNSAYFDTCRVYSSVHL